MVRLAWVVLTVGCFAGNAAAKDPKVFPMKFARTQPRRALQKRDPFSVSLGNAIQSGLYYVNASVGTPPQTVQLQIDTGSSDIWMFGPGACNDPDSCLGGSFDVSESSSAMLILEDGFEIQYVTPGSEVVGDYIADDFGMGDVTVKNLTMAVATTAQQVFTGIMGIDFSSGESWVGQGGSPYPNVIDELVNQGLIESASYSLWLDDLNDASGTILFGGYDTAKYKGDLVLLDIQPDASTDEIMSMTVAWTSLAVTDGSGSTLVTPDYFPLPAVLDSGTTFTVVPDNIFSMLFDYFGAVQDEDYGNVVQCNIGEAQGSLDFGFGEGPIIAVPFSELAVPIYDEQNNPLTFQDGTAACQLGVSPSPDGSSILLGDTFLRSAYVVYDLDSLQIGIAQTDFNSTRSNVVEIPSSNSSSNPIASAVSAATGITAIQSETGLVGPGISATATGFGGGGRPTSAGGLGHITGVTTSLALQTAGGASSTDSAGGASSSTSSAALAHAVPIKIVGLLFVCWTVAVTVGAGAVFSSVN